MAELSAATEKKLVKLADIRTDGGTQSRAEINIPTVKSYAERMKEGDEFPPLEVFFDGTSYFLVDGFHRLAAARHCEYEEYSAVIKEGTQREAVLYSKGVNKNHGLQRTVADKRKNVTDMLQDSEWVKWSDREIARHLGVSNAFVSGLRQRMTPPTVNVNSWEPRTYTKNGKTHTMNTGNIGKKTDSEKPSSLPTASAPPAHEAAAPNTPRPLNGGDPLAVRVEPTGRAPVTMSNTKPVITEATDEKPAVTTAAVMAENARLKAEVARLTAGNEGLARQVEVLQKLDIKPIIASLATRYGLPLNDANYMVKRYNEGKVRAALTFVLDPAIAHQSASPAAFLGSLLDCVEPQKPGKRKTIPANRMNPMKDAIVKGFGWDPGQVTQGMWGEIQAAAQQLCEVDCCPEHVSYGVRYLKSKFDSPGPAALAKHYPQWVRTVPKYGPDIDPLWGDPRSPMPPPEDPALMAQAEIDKARRSQERLAIAKAKGYPVPEPGGAGR